MTALIIANDSPNNKEEEKKPNSAILIPATLIVAVRLSREKIKSSPPITAKISNDIRLAEMIQA